MQAMQGGCKGMGASNKTLIAESQKLRSRFSESCCSGLQAPKEEAPAAVEASAAPVADAPATLTEVNLLHGCVFQTGVQ